MQITDKLMKPLTEVKYLNADNVSRYRCIMRIFFDNYEKLHYWLYQEDVFEALKRDPHFEDYRMEQCQQDLAMLTEWKNLNTIQDTRKVASIEEFKNKKFRYQMSEYSVEIERLVIRLENLFVEGARWSRHFWNASGGMWNDFRQWQRKTRGRYIPGGRI